MIYGRYGYSYRGPVAVAIGSEPYVRLPPDGIQAARPTLLSGTDKGFLILTTQRVAFISFGSEKKLETHLGRGIHTCMGKLLFCIVVAVSFVYYCIVRPISVVSVIAALLPLHFLCVSSCFGRDHTLKARCCPTPSNSSVLIGHLLCSLTTLSNEPLFTVHTGPADQVCHVLRLLFL